MSTEASPRPWLCMCGSDANAVFAANGALVARVENAADARLIVDAVNNADSWRDAYIKARTERNAFLLERDRLRDIVRRLIDLFTPGTIHPAGTMERLLREARAAIGEEKP